MLDIDEIMEVDEGDLNTRIPLIRESLNKLAQSIRTRLPENMPNTELVEKEDFRLWSLINLILEGSNNDEENIAFNRLLYFLFDGCKGNTLELLSQFDLEVKTNESGNFVFNLIVNEGEFEDEQTTELRP